MAKGRPGFREWVDSQEDPNWGRMPLTHITRGIVAEDIMRGGRIEPGDSDKLGSFAYLFYGRPAYRVGGGDVIKMEAACPYCFVMDKDLIERAKEIYAFDTGAFNARLYKHILTEDMQLADFSLERDTSRPNKLIKATFGNQSDYFEGNRVVVPSPDIACEAWQMEATAFLHLITSPGRNEPDDRICSIEVVFADPIPLLDHLMAVVAPHTHWNENSKSPWLLELNGKGVDIVPYTFVPGRPPEHYQTLVEIALRERYVRWEVL